MEDPAVVISVVEIASDMVTTLDAIPLAKDMALHAVKSGIASDAWETIVHGADKAASKGLVCAGFKIESPTSLVLVAVPGDLHNSDPAYRDALSSLRAIPSTTYVSLAGKFSTAPPLFSAPCLEVVTFYGIDDGFPKQVEQFVAALNDAAKSMEGYHGAVYGEVAARQPASETEEAAHGRERDVVLLIGWDSKDAHLKAKGIEGGGEWLDICPGWHLVKGSS